VKLCPRTKALDAEVLIWFTATDTAGISFSSWLNRWLTVLIEKIETDLFLYPHGKAFGWNVA
jgi:hypothetical protein